MTLYVKALVPGTYSIEGNAGFKDDDGYLLLNDDKYHAVSDKLVTHPDFQKLWQAGILRVARDAAGVNIVPNASSVSGGSGGPDIDFILGSVKSLPRHLGGSGVDALASGDMLLTYFTADQDITATKVFTAVTDQVVSAPTVSRVGLYSVNDADDLTLIASTAHSASLWSVAWNGYTTNLSAPVAIVARQRYAVGTVFVGTTGPKLSGTYGLWSESGVLPRLSGKVTGQSNLPASLSAGAVGNGSSMVYARFIK